MAGLPFSCEGDSGCRGSTLNPTTQNPKPRTPEPQEQMSMFDNDFFNLSLEEAREHCIGAPEYEARVLHHNVSEHPKP